MKVQVSIISEFNYSESVNGALKGDHHITMATVRERKQLTSEASVKTTLELLLHWNMAVAEQEVYMVADMSQIKANLSCTSGYPELPTWRCCVCSVSQ